MTYWDVKHWEKDPISQKAIARIAQLEAALRPFADLADEIEQTASEAARQAGNVIAPARWDDCQRAREALSK